MQRRFRFASVVVALAATVGCSGSNMGTVTGRVTVDGVPVKQGMVMFHPTDGPTAVGVINPDGTYTLTTTKNGDGAVVGDHRVTISATTVEGGSVVQPSSLEEELAAARKEAGGMRLVPGQVKWVVPERYSRPDTSDLSATVKAGPNEIHFDITKP